MQNIGYLVAAYAIIWLGLLGYAGWIALRTRGVQIELESVRALVEEHEHALTANTPSDPIRHG